MPEEAVDKSAQTAHTPFDPTAPRSSQCDDPEAIEAAHFWPNHPVSRT